MDQEGGGKLLRALSFGQEVDADVKREIDRRYQVVIRSSDKIFRHLSVDAGTSWAYYHWEADKFSDRSEEIGEESSWPVEIMRRLLQPGLRERKASGTT